ncbi:uncharacterized protein LOC114263293 [Camellia sinensis]|uniref:uncharacterized protein LOC114263293 n=1 Tax=Camellia sinensis TaxID=4442 RepID=UPI001035FDC0|nr:uncharacterized protein LOC114263293 [Camellia sinensis]
MTWNQFKEIIYEKYFPQCFEDCKVSEFEQLKQNNMSVAEYEAKFTELARFAPHMVDTDYKKARKFEEGLNLDVFDRVEINEIEIVLREYGGVLAAISAQLVIIEELKEKQLNDEFLKKMVDEIDSKSRLGFVFEGNILKFQGRLRVPDCSELRKRIMTEAHSSKFVIHLGNTKMYKDLKQNF